MRDNQIASTEKTNQHQLSTEQSSHKKPLVYLAWDIQNVKSKQNKLPSLASDLLEFCRQKWHFTSQEVFDNFEKKNQADAKNILEGMGFKCINIPDASKNSADKTLIYHCTKQFPRKPSPDIFVLILGDRDYVSLICLLRAAGKEVIIFAQRGSESKKLINRVDEFHFIDELPKLLGSKIEPNIEDVLACIPYKDAKECLFQAIKTANSHNKKTGFSSINNLMLDNKQFPNYTGYASIRQADGNKFSSFTKFVKAIEKDGKVFVKNNEVFFIEEGKMAA
jgi:uncharacterized LabA/DUF88 family protein